MTGGSNATALNTVKGYLQGETHSAWRARSRGPCRLAVTEAGAPGFERAKIGGRRGGVCGHLLSASKPQCRQVAPWGEREAASRRGLQCPPSSTLRPGRRQYKRGARQVSPEPGCTPITRCRSRRKPFAVPGLRRGCLGGERNRTGARCPLVSVPRASQASGSRPSRLSSRRAGNNMPFWTWA